MPRFLCNRLTSLELGITDETGPGAVRYQLRSLTVGFDYDDGHPFSNLQMRHPNIDLPKKQYPLFEGEPNWKLPARCGATSGNEAHFFHLVSRCPNLEILGLIGTQFLSGDLLQWLPTAKGLKHVLLYRVKMSAANLIKLLSPAVSTSSSQLARLWLDEVNLTAGSWAEVFEHLISCEELVVFHRSTLCYDRGGESMHLRAFSGRMWDDERVIWSEDYGEWNASARLDQRIYKRKRGLGEDCSDEEEVQDGEQDEEE